MDRLGVDKAMKVAAWHIAGNLYIAGGSLTIKEPLQPETPYNEKMLLQQISEGDEAAFRQLFDTYRNQLYTYLFKIIKVKEPAEEILLDVFVKIWTSRALAVQINHFEAFLFKVARNMAIDFLRTIQRSPERQEELWEAIEAVATTKADEHLVYVHTQALIQEAVAQLSPQRRMVFELSREQGYTYEQIAAQMNLSVNTVRNHLSAALSHIRTHLSSSANTLALVLALALKKE